MIKVGICDDEHSQVELLKGMFYEFYQGEESAEVETFYSGEELLSTPLAFQLDVLFLDIQMKNVDGISVGEKVREENTDTIIVFITGYKEHAVNAFNINAFHYLIKPVDRSGFSSLVTKIERRLKEINYYNSEEQLFTIERKGEILRLKYNDIYFFVKKKHKIILHHKYGIIEFPSTIKEVKDRLNMDFFTQPNEGTLVNVKTVLFYKDKALHLNCTSETIPVSRSKLKEVKDAISRQLFEF